MQETANEDEALWRRLDWNDVRIFLAVAEAGSLNAAAAVLGMTQPTISRRMEDLEIRLAVRLFDRSSRGAALTQAGETMHDLAVSMARFGGAIVREVAGRDRVDVGRVRLNVPDGIASFLLMPALADFQRINPQVELSIDCGLWQEHAFSGEVDLTLDFSSVSPPDAVSIPVATFHYALYASPEYLSTYGTPKTLAEVANHRLVRHTAYKEQRENWHPKVQAVTDLAGRHLVTNSSAAMLMAVRCGAGIASLPTVSSVIDPGLVVLNFDPVTHAVLWLRHRTSAARQGRIKRVIEWIHQVFETTAQPWFRTEYIHPREFGRIAAEAAPAPTLRDGRAKLAG
jgi:DNA-binding transcriptional LysR family regulator